MNLRDFQERVRALRFIDFDEFEASGVASPKLNWPPFQANPVLWLCIAPAADAEAVWNYMEERLPPGQLAGPPDAHHG